MSTVILSLEVTNAFNFPKEAEAMSRELERMRDRLESEPDYTEEDQFLVQAFDGDFRAVDTDDARSEYRLIMEDFSAEFPNLVFALDVKVPTDLAFITSHETELRRREYFLDGERQIVKPYLVVPEFDPEGEFE